MSIVAGQPLERVLLLFLFGSYLFSCLHWVKHGQTAWTLVSREGWTAREVVRGSYTLLSHMPVLANPFETRGCIAVIATAEPGTGSTRPRSGPELWRHTGRLGLAAAMSAFYLLCVVPLTLITGRLSLSWAPLLIGMLLLHGVVVAEFWLVTGAWRRHARTHFVQALLSILLNPVSALRAADLVAQWWVQTSRSAGGDDAP